MRAEFFLPYVYTLRVNRRGLEGVAYALEFFLAPFVLAALMGQAGRWVELLLVQLAVVSVYEAGYIHNNCIAVTRERAPTLRHSPEGREFGRRNFAAILLVRAGWAAGAVMLPAAGFESPLLRVALFGGLGVLLGSFLIYNCVRTGLGNRLLFGLLRFGRYGLNLCLLGWAGWGVAAIMSAVSLVNNLAWYPQRSALKLGRFFGTKIFDALVFGLVAALATLAGARAVAQFFVYLAVVKVFLFAIKLLLAQHRGRRAW